MTEHWFQGVKAGVSSWLESATTKEVDAALERAGIGYYTDDDDDDDPVWVRLYAIEALSNGACLCTETGPVCRSCMADKAIKRIAAEIDSTVAELGIER